MASPSVESSLSKMPLAHRQLVKRYLTERQANGLAEASLSKYAAVLLKASRSNDKPFEKWTRDDCVKLLSKIRNQNSKNSHGILLKNFARWLGRESMMAWWRPRPPPLSLPDAVPTHEEIEAILKETPGLEYRSLLRVLADSGARVGSILDLKVHQITFDEHGAKITLPRSKTGQGLRLRLVSSSPILRDWLNQSPRSPDGRVWNVCYQTLNRHFHAARRRAGIEKPMTIHGLRHARATELTRFGMSELLLRRHFGWAPGSRMTERYAHLSGKDLDDAVLRANGVQPPEEAPKPGQQAIICPTCGTPNDSSYSFCVKCSSSLTGASVSVDGLVSVLNKLLETTELTSELEKISQSKQTGLVGGHIFDEERMIRALVGMNEVSKKIALGLVALSQGAKKLDAEADRELAQTKRPRKPRARTVTRVTT